MNDHLIYISDALCADADAVLLLENIKYQNYINEDRHIGFDTETTMAILKVLDVNHKFEMTLSKLINSFKFIDSGTIPCKMHRNKTYATEIIRRKNKPLFESGQPEHRR